MLRAPRLTLAVAESVTCGRVQARLGAESGASDFFLGGITAYTLEQKVRHLGVERAGAAACGCVSAGVAAQMARGAAALFGADVGVATTGFAESPAGAMKEGGAKEPGSGRGEAGADASAPEPFAFWAVAWRGAGNAWHTRTGKIVCLGVARVAAQTLIADAVLAELQTHLRSTRAPA